MKLNFKKSLMLLSTALAFIYLSWSFVELSFTIPFIESFKNPESRFGFLGVILILFLCSIPLSIEFENEDEESFF